MGKIAYITVTAPYGLQESFVLTEMLALKENGADLLIIPRDKIGDELFHKKAEPLFADAIATPLIDFSIALSCLKYILRHPISFLRIIHKIAIKARSIKIAFKNLAILPKSIYFAAILSRKSIDHVHAHWASTTATMAYIIALLTGIPWSFTAHRWDITENNILKEKCRTALFARIISERGRKEVAEIIKDKSLEKKVSVIYMGVDIPGCMNDKFSFSEPFTFLCPANLYTVKGHRYLLEACRILLDKGIKFKCLIAGDGYLEDELKKTAIKLNLSECVEFLGRLPHERLFSLYANGVINAVTLPSIKTEDGEEEGIPVVLMEAMANGIPVISTNTGGIPELIGDGSGIMVAEKEPDAIASAIEKLMRNQNYYNFISSQGRERILRDFNTSTITGKLLILFAGGRRG